MNNVYYSERKEPGQSRSDFPIDCVVAVPGREEFRHAARLAADDALKLRAGDALHLANAASLGAPGILCLDDAMIGSAKSLGMKVITV